MDIDKKAKSNCYRDAFEGIMYWKCFKARFSCTSLLTNIGMCQAQDVHMVYIVTLQVRSALRILHALLSMAPLYLGLLFLTDFHREVRNNLKSCIRGQSLYFVKLPFYIPGFRHGLHCHEPSQELVTLDSCMATWVQIICVVHTVQASKSTQNSHAQQRVKKSEVCDLDSRLFLT